MNLPQITTPNLDPYLSFDFIIRSEVIIPSLVVLVLGWITLRYQQRAENDENFINLKFKFTDIWADLAMEEEILNKEYKLANKKQRFKVFKIIEFFSVVWFLHIRKKSAYSKEWEHNTRHVFKNKIVQTAFSHIVLEKKQSFNEEWIKYINKVINETQD